MSKTRRTNKTLTPPKTADDRPVEVIEARDPARKEKVVEFINHLAAATREPGSDADCADWKQPSKLDSYVLHREQWI